MESIDMMKKQRGITMMGALIGLSFFVFFAVIAMRLLPMYQEYYGVTSVMKTMEVEMKNSSLTKQQAWTFLWKRLDSSYVESVEKHHVKFFKGKTGTGIGRIVIDYSVRKPLMGNLDIVGKFHSEVSVD